MSDREAATDGLNLVSKFAGEAFGIDNVRTVFASASQDNVEREDRVVVLIGPAGTGKSTLIDCMCNYFYGAELKSNVRYKIADEIFDQTTPKKTIIKYVFNETRMPYRPVVIDTPGIGSESGVQTDAEISAMLKGFLLQSHRVVIHAIGFVLRHTDIRVSVKREEQIKETLSMFPKWMLPNVVPMLSSSDGTGTIPPALAALFKNLGLSENRVFFFNSGSLFDVTKAEAITAQLRTTYWTMTMQALDDFFEHVSQLNPQCIAEQLPPSTSPSLVFEKQYKDGIYTPNYTPPPPAVIDKRDENMISSDRTFSTRWSTNVARDSADMKASIKDTSSATGALYSKIRKTSQHESVVAEEKARERIIPIKILNAPSKEYTQVVESHKSHFDTSSERHTTIKSGTEMDSEGRKSHLDTSTEQHLTIQMETDDDHSSPKRYTYDPTSMSHKEHNLTDSVRKESTTGEGIDLAKDTTAIFIGDSSSGGIPTRPHRVQETLINDVPLENLVNSSGYKHIKSYPPPEYTPEQTISRQPLARIAGNNQQHSQNIQQRITTSMDVNVDGSKTDVLRIAPQRHSYHETADKTPSTALSAASDWTYQAASETNVNQFDSNTQRMSSTQQQRNDFIITPQMRTSDSPVLFRVTMGKKDRNVQKIDGDQQTLNVSKARETNIDDVAPPEYDGKWTEQTVQSAARDEKNLKTSSYNADVITGYATSYEYGGNAGPIPTKTTPKPAGETVNGQYYQNITDVMETNIDENINQRSSVYAQDAGQTALLVTTPTSKAFIATSDRMSGYDQCVAAQQRVSGYGYGDTQTTTTVTTTMPIRTSPTTADGSAMGRYKKGETAANVRGQGAAMQRVKGYSHGDEEETVTTTTATTNITNAGAGAVNARGQRVSMQRGQGYSYGDAAEEETATTTTTTKGIVSTGGASAMHGGTQVASARLSTGYGDDEETLTTTTTNKNIANIGGANGQRRQPGVYGRQVQSAMKKGSQGYGYDEDETTTTTTKTIDGGDGAFSPQKQGEMASSNRRSGAYGEYDDEDEFTTTTKSVTTAGGGGGGVPRVPLHQTQQAYRGERMGKSGYGYDDDEEITTTKTTARYDLPPGNIESAGQDYRNEDVENQWQSRAERDDLLGHRSSFQTQQYPVPPKNYLERSVIYEYAIDQHSSYPKSSNSHLSQFFHSQSILSECFHNTPLERSTVIF
ncbi:unnamed protein product [Anisakis simplex]|uniref:RNA polymerase II-associated factor 1 homolog n=1 Tax=Anisakis simplex TaxID=6269 RepID=A0A0M3JTK0_ANISI|nr:unnamed protein product [Anisakis simplex]